MKIKRKIRNNLLKSGKTKNSHVRYAIILTKIATNIYTQKFVKEITRNNDIFGYYNNNKTESES